MPDKHQIDTVTSWALLGAKKLLSGHCDISSTWLACLLSSPNIWISFLYSSPSKRLEGISYFMCIRQRSVICSHKTANILLRSYHPCSLWKEKRKLFIWFKGKVEQVSNETFCSSFCITLMMLYLVSGNMELLRELRLIMGLEVTLLTSKGLLQPLVTKKWQWIANGIIFHSY